jgi:preprotein translocase subunit SecG
MFFSFLLVVHFLVALALVTVILMQRSEGGGLTGGGSPAGLMSARGAADFLTRSTAILATAFVVLSIVLAVLAATRHATTIDTSVNRVAPVAPAPNQPVPNGGAFGGDAANAAAGVGGSANLSFPGVTTPQENRAAPGNTTAPAK